MYVATVSDKNKRNTKRGTQIFFVLTVKNKNIS